MAVNYLIVYSEQLATEIELVCQKSESTVKYGFSNPKELE